MPRRSTGCEKCRQRKLRCDEAKPQCQRCKDYGITCPGYRPSASQDFHFVDQTRDAARKAGSELVQQQKPLNVHINGTAKPYRWRNRFHDPTPSEDPKGISAGHVHRVQLLSTFLDLYLPKKLDRSMTSYFGYVAELPHIDIASPLLQVCIDTICLAELGALYQDERCIQESRARYVRALPMLAKEISKPESRRMRSDHILAAITLLALCELFDVIAKASGNGQGWISHVEGAQQFIKAIGTEIVDSRIGNLLLHQIRHASLCMGFLRRKRLFFAEPEWLNATAKQAKTDAFVALYDLAVQVPGVLERADALATADALSAEFSQFCEDVSELRCRFDSWLQTRYIDQHITLYTIVDVRSMTDFSQLCLNRTFQTVFNFDTIQICSQQQLYWICCLVLDWTLLSVYQTANSKYTDLQLQLSLETFTSRTEEDINREMYTTATNYCRSLPFCCTADAASIGRMGSFLLKLTQQYFERTGYCAELEWCKAVMRMFDSDTEIQAQHAPHSHNNTNAHALANAPWNVKHKCKAPICNFRIECVAPAPMMLLGEYAGKGTYAPRKGKVDVEVDHAAGPKDLDSVREYANMAYGSHTSGKVRTNGTSALADGLIPAPG